MRIGIEAQRIFRPKKHGMDIVALEMIKALQKIDQENEYIIFVKPDEDTEALQATDNFRIYPLKAFTYADWEQWQLPRAARQEKVDLLHCTSNTAPLLSSIPLLLTLHDIIYLEKIPRRGTPYQILGNWYRRWVVPWVADRSKKIITVSQFEKDKIQKNLQPQQEVMVVYNGISQAFRELDDPAQLEACRRKYKLPEKFLFFLGNMAPKKNMKHLLKAYGLYCDKQNAEAIPLVIAESRAEQVKKMLDELDYGHLMNKIILTGYIKHQDLPAVYNLCYLFLYPSLRESFGIPIIEAMACLSPVITSNTSSMPEVAGNAAYLIDPHYPEQISEAILILSRNEKLRQQLIALGVERAKNFR